RWWRRAAVMPRRGEADAAAVGGRRWVARWCWRRPGSEAYGEAKPTPPTERERGPRRLPRARRAGAGAAHAASRTSDRRHRRMSKPPPRYAFTRRPLPIELHPELGNPRVQHRRRFLEGRAGPPIDIHRSARIQRVEEVEEQPQSRLGGKHQLLLDAEVEH